MAISVRLESGGPGGEYWYAAWQNAAGRKRTKSIGSKNKIGIRQAKKQCAEIQNELAQRGGLPGGKCPTISKWKLRFVSQRDLKKATIAEYETTVKVLLEAFGDVRLDRITREDAASFRGDLRARKVQTDPTKKNPRAISESTVRKHIRNCKALFREASEQDIIPFNPFDKQVGAPLQIDQEWRLITLEETEQLLAACPSSKWRVLIGLTRYAGLRLREALNLTWGMIDHDARTLIVKNQVRKKTTKDKERLVAICPELHKLLLERFEDAGEGETRVVGFSHGYMQGGGGAWGGRTVISQIYTKAKVPKGDPFHDLRRSLETEWQAQYPAMDVCKMLGHDENVARRHYHKVSEGTINLISGAAQDEKTRRIEELERENARLVQIVEDLRAGKTESDLL